ncbi:hypothetical protein [Pseudomonas fluorescens]|uniref:Uncharacterized protein n=1 Tax=Pseudomonas fluorescens TaxID=294 RepID=A0A5E7ETL8_PSEFL|nr:hypothetical protein [Pseudomonas fluorescens]VVO30236.1 hypothetical protein PS723_04930 [Pseudomonas fluorescens]
MKQTGFSAANAAQIIKLAFAPMRCEAEPWDYDHRIRFRVFDSSDEPALTVEELLKHEFSNASSLESAINSWRSRLAQRGFDLDRWVFPRDDQYAT